MSAQTAYQELLRLNRERKLLGSCSALLEWDEDTYMPAGGAGHRAEQQALLARIDHEWASAPSLGELLAAVEGSPLVADPDSVAAANLRHWREEYEEACLLPASLVEELARTTTIARESWAVAHERREAAHFLPELARVISLKQAEADCLARGRSRYDALLDGWEPGLTTAVVAPMLARIEATVRPLLARASGEDDEVLRRPVPVAAQRALCHDLAGWLGFDPEQGRLDEALHPSTMAIGPGDVRITNRYGAEAIAEGIFATLHEVGHGLYELNLPAEHYGAPVGEAVGYGLHESQSRLLENQVGRSLAFARFLWPRVVERLRPIFDDVSVEAYHRGVNRIAPGWSRIRADEVTYDLHILVRVELEQALLSGDLAVGELPGAWTDAYARLLGVRPADDAEGCLQDGHWAEGMIGYFPTYTLGNAIAAQLMATLRRSRPDLDDRIAAGDLAPLLDWLREAVHRRGALFPTDRLIREATGEPFSVEPLVAYLSGKLAG